MTEKAFKEFFQGCYSNCYAKLYSIAKNEAETEDAILEAMTIYWERLQKSTEPDSNPCGFVYTIARNLWYRKQKSKETERKKQEPYKLSIVGEDNSLEEEIDLLLSSPEEKNIVAVRTAFNNLGDKCKSLLQKYLVDDLRLKDIWESLGYSSYDSIKSSKRQCLKQLITKFNLEIS